MKKLDIRNFLLIFLTFIHHGNKCSAAISNDKLIVVIGSSDVGKSASVKKLLQEDGNVIENDEGCILNEYSISLEGIGTLRILDTPGLVNSRTVDEDAQSIALIKNYLSTANKIPEIVIFVAKIDDDRASGPNSLFVQALKRAQLIKNQLIKTNEENKSNFVLLLTRFGALTRQDQRRPKNRISHLKKIVIEFSDFKSNFSVVVGENEGAGNGFTVSDGETELPNGEKYPQNLIKKIIETDLIFNQDSKIDQFLNQRPIAPFTLKSIKVEPAMSLEKDVSEFISKLISAQYDIKETEISSILKNTWETVIDAQAKELNPNALALTQKAFQNGNISTMSDLPETTLEIVKLMRLVPPIPAVYTLIENSFNLRVPDLNTNLIAGYGYDLLTDQLLLTSPLDFSKSESSPSELGYKIPSYLVFNNEKGSEDVFYYFTTWDDYVHKRLELVGSKSTVKTSAFEGKLRLGYNVEPQDASEQFTIIGLREMRTFSLQMESESSWEQLISSDFKNRLNELNPFDSSDRESEKEWKFFFNEYGTHMVTKAFGGGYIQGSIEGVPTKYTKENVNELRNELKKSLLLDSVDLPTNFKIITNTRVSHAFFGGLPKPELEFVFSKNQQVRTSQIRDWEETINLKPVMLETRFELKPLSEIAALINREKGAMVAAAAELLYKGELVYKRKSSSSTTNLRPKATTVKPKITSTTTTTSPYISYTPTSKPNYDSNCPPPPKCECKNENKYAQKPGDLDYNKDNFPETTTSYSYYDTYLKKQNKKTERLSWDKRNIRKSSLVIVGHGYNMFFDEPLKKSPFELGRESLGPNGVSIYSNLKIESDASYNLHKCQIVDDKVAYIKNRIMNIELDGTFKYFTHKSFKDVSIFPMTRKKWYTIIGDGDDTVHQLIYKKSHKLTLFTKNELLYSSSLSIKFSTEFIDDVNKLPDSCDYPNCTNLKEWMKFYEKYGTHVVIEGFLGREEEYTNNECSERRYFQANNSKTRMLGCELKFIDMSQLVGKVNKSKQNGFDFCMEDIYIQGLNCTITE